MSSTVEPKSSRRLQGELPHALTRDLTDTRSPEHAWPSAESAPCAASRPFVESVPCSASRPSTESTRCGEYPPRRSAPAAGESHSEQRLRPTELHQSGEVIGGSYHLDRKLGGGAMGDIWLARDTKLARQVAVKLVHFDKLGATDARRLKQEAQLTARIQHRNVVTVFDTGTQDTTFYLAMELLEGRDLASLLTERGSFDACEAVRLILPVLNGVAAAHAQDVIHRDIKPENVFLEERSGRCVPKVVDFGVALARDLPASLRLTQAGLLVGTPLYMAPEQFAGRSLDERVDVWAICTMIYELIAGTTPFPYDLGITELIARIAAPDPIEIGQEIEDAELRAVLQRGLQKNREYRWPSVRYLGTALAHWLWSRGVHEDISGENLSANWLRDSAPLIEIHEDKQQFALSDWAWRGREWIGAGSNKKKLMVAAACGLVVAGQAMAQKLDSAAHGADPSAAGVGMTVQSDVDTPPEAAPREESSRDSSPEAADADADADADASARSSASALQQGDDSPSPQGNAKAAGSERPTSSKQRVRGPSRPIDGSHRASEMPASQSAHGSSDQVDPRWGF